MTENSSRVGKIIKYTFKAIGLLLVLGTVGILLWRFFSSGDPQSTKTLYVNDATYEAWQAAEAEGRDMVMYSQAYDDITRADHNRGYFSVTQTLFIEDADQVQITFRYNNSTLRHVKEDYHLAEIPDRGEDLFDVSLVVIYDLTPENQDDNEKQTFASPDDTTEEGETVDINRTDSVMRVRYSPSAQEPAQKNVYNYRKLVFDGVDLSGEEYPVLGIFVDVYYKDDIDYTKNSYGTLSIYNYNFSDKAYKLTGDDKEALAAFGKES